MRSVPRPASTRSRTSSSKPRSLTANRFPARPPMAGTRRTIMIKTTVGIATLALACGLAVGAKAQLVTTKHLTLPIAATIATTAMETCKGQGYNVSVHIIGDMGEVLVALRGDN